MAMNQHQGTSGCEQQPPEEGGKDRVKELQVSQMATFDVKTELGNHLAEFS